MLYIGLKHRLLRGEAGNAVVTVLAGTVWRWEAREEVEVPLVDGLAGRWDRIGCRGAQWDFDCYGIPLDRDA